MDVLLAVCHIVAEAVQVASEEHVIVLACHLSILVGPASSRPCSPHWAEERSESSPSLHCSECGGEDLGSSQVQAERG